MASERMMRQMRRLLQDEREALLQGELARLDGILKRKGVLIDSFEKNPPETEQLLELRGLLSRNQALANAAQAGIRAVSQRLESLAQGVPSGTYGADGARTTLAGPRRTLTKRA